MRASPCSAPGHVRRLGAEVAGAPPSWDSGCRAGRCTLRPSQTRAAWVLLPVGRPRGPWAVRSEVVHRVTGLGGTWCPHRVPMSVWPKGCVFASLRHEDDSPESRPRGAAAAVAAAGLRARCRTQHGFPSGRERRRAAASPRCVPGAQPPVGCSRGCVGSRGSQAVGHPRATQGRTVEAPVDRGRRALRWLLPQVMSQTHAGPFRPAR